MHFFWLPPKDSHRLFLLGLGLGPEWWSMSLLLFCVSPMWKVSPFFVLEEMALGGSNRMSCCWPWLWTSSPPPPSLHQHPSNVSWLKLIQDPKTSGAFFFSFLLFTLIWRPVWKKSGTQWLWYGVSLSTDRLSQGWAVWCFDHEFGLLCLSLLH